ncbi:glycerol dehydrogenase Gcy1 [Sporothrix brasiliensis 5110]|uniref:Glycerol dehydrogenase Gcy1 n=1 Tax=Sporothrix brasiliensis 5110 TaxID=1398154 RepID=A0A0C2IUF7_9PEZI|nr:glycerol dehydrogenase Gcy1 [Sporothrix brasiliensis 5110]KIH92766.1 glycerol dehydrogenase Gcy1 [Sporothrix brasiliensis 5110]
MVQNTSRTFTLNDGRSIPAVGLGTWQSKPNEVRDAVKFALQHGYRHVDTALNYGNEQEVGEGIRRSGVAREQIWVTTKLDNPWHHRVAEGFEKSLSDLDVGYIDLFLMHFPCSTDPDDATKHLPDWDYIKTWKEMQKLVDAGKVKSIGVSNFQIRHLEKLLGDPSCKIVPAVNQIELHPCNPSPKLLDFCKAKGIHCTAYSCLGGTAGSPINNSGPLMDEPAIVEIAAAKGKTPQQIVLMWGLQRGTSIIPKSVTPARIEQNFALDGWSLAQADMDRISAVKGRFKVVQDAWMPIRVFFGDDE